MGYVAKGLSNAEIAAQANVSEPTVKTHIARILMKLGLRDRVQVLVYAYEHGLASPARSAARSAQRKPGGAGTAPASALARMATSRSR